MLSLFILRLKYFESIKRQNVESILRHITELCSENKCVALLLISAAEESHHWSMLQQEFHNLLQISQRLSSSQHLRDFAFRGKLKNKDKVFNPIF